jgi:phosphoribosylaminoimidazole-succinocarboxamide synthase
MCNRPLDKPAAWAAGYPVGPKCAKKRGLLLVSHKSEAVRVDDRQIDMFDAIEKIK